MPKTITVCERGECGGECLRCTYRRLSRQYATLEAKHKHLRAAISRMRTLQREYFQCRDQRILKQAKQAETAVDKLLVEVSQPALF